MADGSIVLDLWFVRLPGDENSYERLWNQIDEHALEADLRLHLAENGFRAGVCGPQIPRPLEAILENDMSLQNDADEDSPPAEALESFNTNPKVKHRHLQIRPGMESRIVASDVYDRISLLVSDRGQVSGKTVRKAQGIFTLRTASRPDHRVGLELVPAFHHGEPKQSYVPIDGGYGLDVSRPHEVYDQLQIKTDLAPGEMLVLSRLPDRPGSLGDYFFRSSHTSSHGQKLLIIRLSQRPYDGLFDTETIRFASSKRGPTHQER